MTLAHVSKNWMKKNLLKWYRLHGRADLPWKKPLNAYSVWVSEIMLQQTQVNTVIGYFERFIKAFPNIRQLAKSPLDEVLQHWSGLGYYARARNLHKTANLIVEQYQGKFPTQQEILVSLPGIGRSTAGAILAQAFEISAPILDGNVKRVLSRFHCISGWYGQKEVERKLWQLAEFHTPTQQVGDFTQAIMDLGATCCTRSQPLCLDCPLKTKCLAYLRGEQHLYPHKKPKKPIPTRQVTLLCLTNTDGDILLQQRPPKGIWGGLWSFPEFDDLNALQALINKKFPKRAIKLYSLPEIEHTFTHFHLQIFPMFATLLKSQQLSHPDCYWIKTTQLSQRGFPAPIQKILHLLPRGKK